MLGGACNLGWVAAYDSTMPPDSPPDTTLAALMAAYQDGDARAFEQLYERICPGVRSFLRSLARNNATADDLTQQTFLKVHRARATYVRGLSVEAWIFAIARRTFLDEHRRQSRSPLQLSQDGILPDQPAATSAQPDLQARFSQALRSLQQALDSMPQASREALMLLKVDGLSVSEAADVAGVSKGALKVRAHRGYNHVRRLLGVSP